MTAPLARSTPQADNSRVALAAMYTGVLTAEGSGLGLAALLVLAESFYLTSAVDAAEAPLTPPMMLQALAFALEEHHAAALAELTPLERHAYVAQLAEMRTALRSAIEPAWDALADAMDSASERAMAPPPSNTPPTASALLRALYRAVCGWLARPGTA